MTRCLGTSVTKVQRAGVGPVVDSGHSLPGVLPKGECKAPAYGGGARSETDESRAATVDPAPKTVLSWVPITG